MFSIGEASKLVGLKVPTIRYYEQAGLMPVARRTLGNQRTFSQADIDKLLFIKHARELGFSIKSIFSLLQLSSSNQKDCQEIDQIARSNLEKVRDKIALLTSLKNELERMLLGCNSGAVDNCYVVESLARHELCFEDH